MEFYITLKTLSTKVMLKTRKLILRLNYDTYFKLITIVPHGDKLKATAHNASGMAYLQVIDYLSKIVQKDEPISNLKMYVTLSSTSAIYDSEHGHQRIICFVNNQKLTKLGHTKVLNYYK